MYVRHGSSGKIDEDLFEINIRFIGFTNSHSDDIEHIILSTISIHFSESKKVKIRTASRDEGKHK